MSTEAAHILSYVRTTFPEMQIIVFREKFQIGLALPRSQTNRTRYTRLVYPRVRMRESGTGVGSAHIEVLLLLSR